MPMPRLDRGATLRGDGARLLVVVPYRARDLEGLTLVSHRLNRRYGHEVRLVNGYHLGGKILDYAPDAVVFDHLAWDFKARQARMVNAVGAKVIVLPTEGLFQDREGAVRRAGKLHGVAGLVDCYLAWGQYPRAAIIDEALLPPERVHAVGCPRFDLYLPPFTTDATTREQLVRRLGFADAAAPLVLWATNTPYSGRSAEKMLARQVGRARKPEAEVRAHVEDHHEQFREHSRVVRALAERHDDWNFVIKVHPAEWINPYVECFAGMPNVRLAYDAPIHDFLRACDVLLQRNCTTATEAWMLGKPVINMEIGTYRRPVRDEYRRGSQPATSLDEVDAHLASFLAGAAVPPEQQAARDAFIREFYYRVDGRSADRCADLMHAVLSEPAYGPDDRAAVARAHAAARSRWEAAEDARLPNRLKDLLGWPRDRSWRFWSDWTRREGAANLDAFVAEPEITADMITPLLARFDALEAAHGHAAATARRFTDAGVTA